tara:strand:+ start:184 stop:327 length:144 start_codon:yes stop_codon:yes gene_type:complete
MKNFIGFFAGKKTFIVGGLMIILGIINSDNALVLQGLGMITLRLGMK